MDVLRPVTPPAGLPTEADVLGRTAGENFPVALRILPARTREHLVAIYGYARLTDELGDHLPGGPDARLAALDWLEGELALALRDPDRKDLYPLVTAVALTVRRLGADPQPLRDLIEANRLDQRLSRYGTFQDLVAYCQQSANPVGRLVLAAFEQTTAERERWSDRICTGLQLAEHWQDVGEDAAAGRIYLPQEDLVRFQVPESDLLEPRASRNLRALLVFEVARARRLLDEGAPLVSDLRGRARLAVAAFAGGGYAALDAIADAGFDPLATRATPAKARVATYAARLLRARRPPTPARSAA